MRAELARRLRSVGKFVFARTAALIMSFLLAGAVVGRFGDAELGAYQISFTNIAASMVLALVACASVLAYGAAWGVPPCRL